MKEIKKIIVIGHSGYTSATAAFTEKLIITPRYIWFKHSPFMSDDPEFRPDPNNEMYSWKYESNQPSYRNFFELVSHMIQQAIKSAEDYRMVMDAGTIDYEIQYSDGTKEKFHWRNGGNLDEDIIKLIRQYAPSAHPIPNLLWLDSDWEGEEDDDYDEFDED